MCPPPSDNGFPMKPLLASLHGVKLDRPPFWFMRQAGRYLPEYRALRKEAPNFVSFCLSPEMAAEATLQPIRRYGMDGAILFADILLLPDALGRPVSFVEGVGPVFEPVQNADPLFAEPDWLEKLKPVGETVRRVRASLPQETTLIGFAGAPWTVATYLVEGGTSRDQANTRLWAYADPAGFDRLIERLTETTIEYLCMQVDAGAEAVQLFDSWAGALPADGIERWNLGPCARISAALKAKYPDLPVIMFPKGVGAMTARFAASGAFACIGLDSSTPPEWAAATVQQHCAVQGNLDPMLLLVGGETMEEAASEIVQALAGGQHIFNLGHGVVPQTDPDQVARLSDAIRGR